MSRFQFVADNSATYPVKRLCELVEIERSSYYAWKAGAPARAQRAAADAVLAKRIRAVHAKRIRAVHEEDKTCGAPRITAELNDGAPAEQRVNHKRVARVMRAAGIAGYVKKRRVRTTILVAGADSIDDMALLRHGGMGRVFSDAYAPSTLGSFLRAFTFASCPPARRRRPTAADPAE